MNITAPFRPLAQIFGNCRSACSITAALMFIFSASLSDAALVTYNTVALSGWQAPGGGTYSFVNGSVINNAGQTAFIGNLVGISTSSNTGIWSDRGGSLTLVARKGSDAPGVPSGVVYSSFTPPVFNSAGQTVFAANLTGSGVDSNNSIGIWSEGNGSLTVVARKGSAASGVPAGGVYSVINMPVLNSAGRTAFFSGLSGVGITTSNDTGIWSDLSGSVALVAREGSAAPGVAAGGLFGAINSPVLNNAGQMAFSADLTGPGVVSSNSQAIWSGESGSLAIVARAGSTAPGLGAGRVFSFLGSPVINNAGQTAFFATLTGTGITTSNNQGIWSEGSGSLALVARTGSAAPGVAAGGLFSDFTTNNPVLNGAGQTAFRATLTGTGITTSNDTGIWSEGSGTLALVAREGSPAAGVATGGLFSSFSSPVINSVGWTAFTGTLTGTGITASNNSGLWASGPDGLILIAREGDLFDVDPGIGIDNRTISTITFTVLSGGEDGRRMSFNDAGTLVYDLTFTDGSSGIFTAAITIPEPSTYALILTSLTMLGWSRWRRQGKYPTTMSNSTRFWEAVVSNERPMPIAPWP